MHSKCGGFNTPANAVRRRRIDPTGKRQSSDPRIRRQAGFPRTWSNVQTVYPLGLRKALFRERTESRQDQENQETVSRSGVVAETLQLVSGSQPIGLGFSLLYSSCDPLPNR